MKKATLVAVLSTLGALPACGGDSSSFDTSPPPIPVPLEEVPAHYADAYCSVLERCSGFLYELIFPLEDCRRLATEAARQGGFSELIDAVDDGRIVYHADKAGACFEAIEARACSELNARELPECEAALAGTVAEDGDCSLDEECEGALICEHDGACPGACVERYGAGTECVENDQCADGLVCSTATAHCVEPAREGTACEGGTEPQCDVGLLCVGNDNALREPGICRPLDTVSFGSAGASCDPTNAMLCEEGLSCVVTGLGEDLGASWECQAIADLGGPCRLGIPEHCPSGEFCPVGLLEALAGAEADCQPLPAAGEPCANRPLVFLPACEAYARCDAGECVELRDLGESCETSAVCYSGSCADGACEPPRSCE
jgi:hypothetical protein